MEDTNKAKVDEHINRALDQDGFYHLKSCVDHALINAIKLDFVRVLSQYSKRRLALPTAPNEIDSILDNLFAEITAKSAKIRENAYKVFSENIKIINISNQKKINNVLRQLGLIVPTLCSFNVLAMEPDRKRFLFHPHQDLHRHISHKTINIWVPLTTGKNIGGMGIAKGAHSDGPLPHFVAPDGHLEIKRSFYEHRERVLFEDIDVGDAIIFDTHLPQYNQ